MEHRQNNVSVKAVSPCHCTATSVLCISCFSCYTEQSYKDHVHSMAVEEQLKQKKSNFQSPAPPPCSRSLLGFPEGPAPPPSSWSHLDPQKCWTFFVRVQLTSLLLISPGLWKKKGKKKKEKKKKKKKSRQWQYAFYTARLCLTPTVFLPGWQAGRQAGHQPAA